MTVASGNGGGIVPRIRESRIRRTDWRRPLLPGAGPLMRVHPAIAFVAVLLVFAVGVGWGGLLGALVLGLLAVAVGALLAATWPRLSPSERALRVLVLVVLVAIALQRLT
ncbi:MAG TPA: DUF6703 family protein [Pseudonocardiaceae bacterium]|jgi:energy-coupling factor transporter transmembrane protein EcfT|nr:DUF6703 family protein [Pseudonocardiaceae bacterium]